MGGHTASDGRRLTGEDTAAAGEVSHISSGKNAKRGVGLVCGKERDAFGGEREQAMAMVMACRHLPTQMMASPGERSGMLTQAARMLDKVGDRRRLEEVNSLMKT